MEEEYHEAGETHDSGHSNRRSGTEWHFVGIIVLLIIVAFAIAYGFRQENLVGQLTDRQKQLKNTQVALEQTRSDFSNSLNSTRDELNGSIAHTHEELVALEQRGERNYFEFDLSRSKYFQHAGPIQISLRKSDPKHKTFDLAMLVDDNVLNKRKVELFEPIWISRSDSQPLQIVMISISQDHAHGYVSAPKYPRPRVVATSATGSSGAQSPTITFPDNQAIPQANPASNHQ